MFKRTIQAGLAVAGLSIASAAAVHASDSPTSSIRSQAMQCYTLYSMMMEEEPEDPYRNNILGSQAMLMGTIYVWNSIGQGQEISQEQFDMANNIAYTAIIAGARTSVDEVAERLIHCEGWREDIISVLALSRENFDDIQTESDVRRVITAIPEPKASYPLQGVSRMELNLVIDEAMARHLN
ncbi:MAG: hypothetical protein GX771_09205 [Halomonadaceae bacterium]|nr:hypothetical protein [Halomonadaceae bacterium]